jgi:hypothetical protein
MCRPAHFEQKGGESSGKSGPGPGETRIPAPPNLWSLLQRERKVRDPVGPRPEREKVLMRMLRLPLVETQDSRFLDFLRLS